MTNSLRDESVADARCGNHRRRGGSIPASSLFFHCGRSDEVSELICKYHYSRRWPSNVQFVGSLHIGGGLFGDSGKAVAGLCISIPPTRWAETVWELSRLVCRPDCRGVPLTLLIRLSIAKVRSEIDLVVSFADRTQGHHGGVYQAAGWLYDGHRKPAMDGVIIDGRFIPGRSCNSLWGTRSPQKLAGKFPAATLTPHYDEGKHLYWKPLGRSGWAKAERLGLKQNKYPKS